jgi:hypothetical protein
LPSCCQLRTLRSYRQSRRRGRNSIQRTIKPLIMSSSAAGYVTSLARQQHLPPPKVLETLSSSAVTNGHALDKMCTFLASEKAKLSHLDLQQHWSDLHGVATTLCRQQEEHQRQGEGGEGDAGDAGRHARALQQMMLDVEAIRSGGYDESTTPSGTPSRHVHFPRDDDDADDQDEPGGARDNINNTKVDEQHNGKLSKEKESKKQAKKKEKKEMKKAAKRERKEAKKRLKKEARKKAKP